jgi:predicted negative regulator of RcsB-dependent stress response
MTTDPITTAHRLRTLAERGSDPAAYVRAGDALAALGLHEAAIRCYERADYYRRPDGVAVVVRATLLGMRAAAAGFDPEMTASDWVEIAQAAGNEMDEEMKNLAAAAWLSGWEKETGL